MHLGRSVDVLLGLLRSEEPIVDDEVIHLWDFLCQRVMFAQEAQQLIARSIDRQLLGQKLLILQHVLVQDFSETASLARFVNVEVQDARRVHVAGLAEFVENVK